MKKVGCVDVVVKDYPVPVGTWPKGERLKEIGLCIRTALDLDLEGKYTFHKLPLKEPH